MVHILISWNLLHLFFYVANKVDGYVHILYIKIKWGPGKKSNLVNFDRCPQWLPLCVHFLILPLFLSQVAMVTWIQSITLQMAEYIVMQRRKRDCAAFTSGEVHFTRILHYKKIFLLLFWILCSNAAFSLNSHSHN